MVAVVLRVVAAMTCGGGFSGRRRRWYFGRGFDEGGGVFFRSGGDGWRWLEVVAFFRSGGGFFLSTVLVLRGQCF